MRRILLIGVLMLLVVTSGVEARKWRWNGEVVYTTMNAKQPATNREVPGQNGTDEIIFYEDFEGAFTWTTHDLTADPGVWHIDDFQPYGGSGMSWWCADAALGGYRDDWYMALDTPPIDLATATNPQLSFQSSYYCEDPVGATSPWDGWDGMNIRISTDDGVTWTVLGNDVVEPDYTCNSLYSFGYQHGEGTNIPGWAGNSSGWGQITADLNAYVGEQVKIRFAFATDTDVSTITNPEFFTWLVDEITVTDSAFQIFYNDGEDSTGFSNISVQDIGGDLWHVEDGYPAAPSPTHVLRCGIQGGSYNPNMNNAVMSPYIDLTGYTAGTVAGDFMVMGNINDPDSIPDVDYWCVEISPDSGVNWYNVTNPWGNPSGSNYVYSDAPATWSWFDAVYTEGNLDFSEYLGYVCMFRVVFESDEDTPTGTGLHIDSVYIDAMDAFPYDCGCTYLHIPFPTSVGFQTHGEAELSNLGTNIAYAVGARWQVQGANPLPLAPNMTLEVGMSLTRNFNWTPSAVGTYWHRAWTEWGLDEDPSNDTCTVLDVEVTPENQWVLGYDNRTMQWQFSYDAGTGAACRFTPADDNIPGAFNVMEAQFLFDMSQAFAQDFDLVIFEGDASEIPGVEITTITVTVTPPGEVNPNWKTVDLSGVPELQGRSDNFWFWIKITDTQDQFPHILGDDQVFGDSHFFVHNGTTAPPSGFDYLIHAQIEPTEGVSDDPIQYAPGDFHLAQNYPNPFNPTTTVRFYLPHAAPVTLKVYNLMGQEVVTIVNQELSAGAHHLEFNAADLASGIYFYRMEAAGFTDMKKMVVLK